MDTKRTLTKADCIRSMIDVVDATDKRKDGSNEGCWGILKPECLKPEYRNMENQLFKLLGGFGCSPHTLGNACFGYFLDGEKVREERYNFIGIANAELTAWAEANAKHPKN